MIVMLFFHVFRVYGGVIVGSAIRSHDDENIGEALPTSKSGRGAHQTYQDIGQTCVQLLVAGYTCRTMRNMANSINTPQQDQRVSGKTTFPKSKF